MKIKNWTKINNYMWQNDITGAVVRVVSYTGKGWQVMAQDTYKPNFFGNVYGKSFDTKIIASKYAIKYLKNQ